MVCRYESEGSVYFDVRAFSAGSNTYAKLCPESVGHLSALAEGEGMDARTAAINQ